jgi:hypothetical protein
MWINVKCLESVPKKEWLDKLEKVRDGYKLACEESSEELEPPVVKLEDSDMDTYIISKLIRSSDIKEVEQKDEELVRIVMNDDSIVETTNTFTNILKQLNHG